VESLSLGQAGFQLIRAEEGNRLRSEEIALLRELIATLREQRSGDVRFPSPGGAGPPKSKRRRVVACVRHFLSSLAVPLRFSTLFRQSAGLY
jgi:hypothetical protein